MFTARGDNQAIYPAYTQYNSTCGDTRCNSIYEENCNGFYITTRLQWVFTPPCRRDQGTIPVIKQVKKRTAAVYLSLGHTTGFFN